MVEQATQDSPKKQSHAGAIIGWGGLALGTIGFIWFIALQLGAGWEDRQSEALEMVKTYKAPGMKFNLTDSTIEIGNTARTGGGFIGQFSWSASQLQGPNYVVTLTWMDRSEHKRATWNVDLEKKSIEPVGAETKEFLTNAGAPAG